MDATICGIDPGLRITGYAVLSASGSDCTIIDAGVCRFDGRVALAKRLIQVERDVCSIFEEHLPEIVAVEQLYVHYRHPRTAVLMGHARGVILLAAARRGIEVRSFGATRVKRYLTGNGGASKQQIQRAVQTTLGLPRIPEPADVADALAVALCCAGDVQGKRIIEVST